MSASPPIADVVRWRCPCPLSAISRHSPRTRSICSNIAAVSRPCWRSRSDRWAGYPRHRRPAGSCVGFDERKGSLALSDHTGLAACSASVAGGGTKKGLLRFSNRALQAEVSGSTCEYRGNIMSLHVLFWGMCAVITGYLAMAIVAITKAYRDDRRLGLKGVSRTLSVNRKA
jgi:hypothetical protein